MAASENEQDIKIDPELTKPWGYPEGFKAALRELYERSFEECEMATDTQLEVLETWRELGADAADLLHDVCDDRYYSPSLHSAKICMAGRPDLTAEMLALSDRWRQHFSSEEIAHTETRQNAFEAFFTRTMSGMKNVPASSTDSRVEDSGYRPLTIGGQT